MLAVVVIGGVIGFIAIAMAVVGLKRAKATESGKGFAIGAILLGVLSIAASMGAAVIIASLVGSGELSLDGLISVPVDETEFPPEDDIIEVACTEDGLALATLLIENPTENRNRYTITVTWENSDGGELSEILNSDVIAPGEQAELRIFQRASTAVVESCRVTEVRRTLNLFG